MKIWNTLIGKKEPIPRPVNKPLRLFVCGPTVYDDIHLGNARTFMVFDMFVRYLRARGTKVTYLQNITDIDDKIITRAKEEHVLPRAIAQKYERAYHEAERLLDITSVTTYARATNFIPQIVAQIKTLVKHGNAYLIPDDGYYFDISTFSHYGELAKRTVLQAEDGVSRIDDNVKKRNKGDFALWKFSTGEAGRKTGEPFWTTALGRGRPGWHIEDTAITEDYFGPQYDIHGGGMDLKFPHHEAEIAQQESASGKRPMVAVWMHVGMMDVRGGKMSKSLGNFITVADFLKRASGAVWRYIVISHHYRARMDYTEESVLQAHASLAALWEFADRLALVGKRSKKIAPKKSLIPLATFRRMFHDAMENDFNTPKALGHVFELVNETYKVIWELSREEANAIKKEIIVMFKSLGIDLLSAKIPAAITAKMNAREKLRKAEKFSEADALRKEIESLGYKVDDTPLGALALRKRTNS